MSIGGKEPTARVKRDFMGVWAELRDEQLISISKAINVLVQINRIADEITGEDDASIAFIDALYSLLLILDTMVIDPAESPEVVSLRELLSLLMDKLEKEKSEESSEGES
jgi:hypothetical protein